MKTIKMTFKPDGEMTIETSGFSGSGCRKATEELEAAMGNVTARRAKSEAYQQQQAQQKATQ